MLAHSIGNHSTLVVACTLALVAGCKDTGVATLEGQDAAVDGSVDSEASTGRVDGTTRQDDASASLPAGEGGTDASTLDASPNAPGVDAGPDAAGLDGAGEDDPVLDAGEDESCGEAATCEGATPVCVEGQCVVCDASDASACGDKGECDLASHTCGDALSPWAPNCAALPQDAACAAGPREVLLAMHSTGRIAMLDPVDGRFLGYLTQDLQPTDEQNDTYGFVTQGPDMCLWTTHRTEGVARRDTDGSFLNAIIAPDTHYDGTDDMIEQVRSIAFAPDAVYVASRTGDPEPRITRFNLQGEMPEVVLADGSSANSLLVLADGRLVVSNRPRHEVFLVDPESGERSTLWASANYPDQVSYVGAGWVAVVAGSSGAPIEEIDLRVRQREKLSLFEVSAELRGVAKLGNGQWLVTGGGGGVSIVAVDPASSPPGRVTELWDDPAVAHADRWEQLGRACLPEAVVEAAAPDWELGSVCPVVPDGPAIFERDFESGNLDGFANPTARGSLVEGGADGTGNSLLIDGGAWDSLDGVQVPLDGAQPTYLGFHMRAAEPSAPMLYGAFVALAGQDGAHLEQFLFEADRLVTSRSRVVFVPETSAWVHVEMHDIDWQSGTYDLCVDGTLRAANVPLRKGAGDRLKTLMFFPRFESVDMWVDDLVIK